MIWLLLALAGKSSQKCKVANMPYTGMLHSDLRGQRQQLRAGYFEQGQGL